MTKELNNRLYGTELFKNFLYAYGVMFPDIEFKSRSDESPQDLVFDNRSEINSYINGIFDWWEKRPQSRKQRLTDDDVKLIASFLCPDFCYEPTLLSVLDETENRLVKLTDEQAAVLDGLSENPRLIVKGGAGTGKTLLASHYAKQCAERGEKTLFLTYNKNLANTVGRHVKNENLKVINIHAFFGEYVKTSAEEITLNSNEYFSHKLPKLFCDYLKSLGDDECEALQFDVIVMDEAQDFVRMENLDALDFVLKNGLEKGRWAVFYDGEQNIYNQEFNEGFDFLSLYSSTKYSLSKNCRNTIQIGKYCEAKSGIKMNTSLCVDGKDVQFVSYTGDKEFKKSVNKILNELRDGKIDLRDVTFLSPRSFEKSKFADLGIEFNLLGEKYIPDSSLPRYATIQGFKGLDSKVVVIAGLEAVAEESFPRYFYIAGTRARTLLYVMSESVTS